MEIIDKETTLKNLQTALAMELTSVHQYQLHASVLEGWGLNRLAAQMRKEMQEEFSHSDNYINRMMFLKGEPNLVLAKPPILADSLAQMFESDLADEKEAVAFYTAAARQANEVADIGSQLLFERTVADEEGHMGWLELQLDILKKMREALYISKHMSPPQEANDSD